MTADRWSTIDEVAAELRISYCTAYRAVQDGRIPAIQLGGPHSAWRVDRKGYRNFLAEKSRRDNAAAQQSGTADGSADYVTKVA